MNIEETIRAIVQDELNKREVTPQLIPAQQFCQEKGLSRATLWRAEKEGKVKLFRIGRRIFIDQGALIVHG